VHHAQTAGQQDQRWTWTSRQNHLPLLHSAFTRTCSCVLPTRGHASSPTGGLWGRYNGRHLC
jgi:hypothetical protein